MEQLGLMVEEQPTEAQESVTVVSKSDPTKTYEVNPQTKSCTCPAYKFGQKYCKHLMEVLGEKSVALMKNKLHIPTEPGVVVTKDQKENMQTYDKYTRTRLSKHFILRDFLYSTEAEVLGIPNRPSDSPSMVVRAGKALCGEVLEPILEAFGPFAITFGYQTRKVIEAGLTKVDPLSSNPHQWDRGTFGDQIYARVDIVPFCISDGLVSKAEFGHWVMHNLDIDLLMMWQKSNVFCITIGPRKRRVWLEWTPKGSGTNGSNRIEHMGEYYWNSEWPNLPESDRPKYGPSLTGGKMW